MAVTTSKTSRFAAFVLIAVNICAMTLWSMVFALGIWTVSSPSSLAAALQSLGSSSIKVLLSREVLTLQLGAALALVSGVMILVSFMGIYAAMARTPFLLMMYSLLVLLLLLLECALLYYFSSYFIEKGLQSQDGQWTHALRLAFQCCEFNASSPDLPSSLPWSCCGAEAHPDNCSTTQLYSRNCQAVITQWIQRYQTAVYASLAVLHILLSSCSLARRRRVPPSRSYS